MCGLLSLCTEHVPVVCAIECCTAIALSLFVDHQSVVTLGDVAVEECRKAQRAKRQAGDGGKHQHLLVPQGAVTVPLFYSTGRFLLH